MRLLVASNVTVNQGANPQDRRFPRLMNRAFMLKASIAQGRSVETPDNANRKFLYKPQRKEKHPRVMNGRSNNVLHVSPDVDLAESRTKALTAIGCQVFSVQTVVAALFEISLGRCGILLLCHKLDHRGRCTLAEYFHQNCPEPYIVAVLGHSDDHYPPQAHVRVVHSRDHGSLVKVMRQRLAAA